MLQLPEVLVKHIECANQVTWRTLDVVNGRPETAGFAVRPLAALSPQPLRRSSSTVDGCLCAQGGLAYFHLPGSQRGGLLLALCVGRPSNCSVVDGGDVPEVLTQKPWAWIKGPKEGGEVVAL